MKKKLITCALAVALIAGLSGLSACKREEPLKVGTGASYGLVHGAGYVGAATVTADSTGKVHYVRIDEFMFPTDWAKANLNNTSASLGKFTDTKTYGTTEYAKYIKIGDKYFEAAGTTAVVYKEINVTNGIEDLMKYIKPDNATAANTLDTAACKWYTEAAYQGKCYILKASDSSSAVTIKDISGSDIKVAAEARAVGSSGGINKAFSAYGGTMYDWIANTSALEKFIYEHGTGFSLADMKKYKADGTAALDKEDNPVTGESADKSAAGTWKIGNAATGVTANDMPDYYMIAKKACEKALAVS